MPKKKQTWLGAITSRFLPATKADVEKLKDLIMANAQQLLAEINALKEQVTTSNAKIGAIAEVVVKIGTETDGLKANIQALEEAITNGEVPDSVITAFNEVKAAATAQEEALADLTTKTNTVDLKVDDAAPPA